jgi:lactate dehydrogenase-like 2-hydroxyacid dehydrogenase
MSSKHPHGPHHHEIVHLQAALAIQFSTDSFALPAPYTHTFTSYDWTSPSEIAPRISTATIVITNIARLTAEILSPAVTPNLQMIAVVAAGTDCVDLEAARKRGLVVCNVPAASTESVAEHAVALYFAVRRRVAELDQLVRGGEWVKKGGTLKGTFLGSYPRTCKLEVVGIVGYGSLGTYQILRAMHDRRM